MYLFFYKLLTIIAWAVKKIISGIEGYFDYFYDEFFSVTPYRGVASFSLSFVYMAIMGLFYSFGEAWGMASFIILLIPIVIHLVFGLFNLIVRDARDIFCDIYEAVKKRVIKRGQIIVK